MLTPYLVDFNPEERQVLVEIGTEAYSFLEKSYKLAFENPPLFPAFVKSTVFGEDFSIVRELRSFAGKLDMFLNNVIDMEMAAGNNALEAALVFYQTLKIAARRDIPGARVLYEELKPGCPPRRQGRRKTVRNERQLELFDN